MAAPSHAARSPAVRRSGGGAFHAQRPRRRVPARQDCRAGRSATGAAQARGDPAGAARRRPNVVAAARAAMALDEAPREAVRCGAGGEPAVSHRTRGSVASRTAALVAAALLALLGGAYYFTYEPAPQVMISWRESTTFTGRPSSEAGSGWSGH